MDNIEKTPETTTPQTDKSANLGRSALIIFVTFMVTSVLYTAAYLFVPAFSGALNFATTKIESYSDSEFTKKLKEVEGYIDSVYINKADKTKQENMAIKGYVAGLGDVYSEYYTAKEYEEAFAELEGNYKGVGIEVTIDSDNLITVLTAYEDAPAAKAGIISGDKIIKVNGKNVNGDNYDEAINMMRGVGKYGKTDKVSVTVKRKEEIFDAEITREEVIINTIKSEMVDSDIGYVKVSSFSEGTDSDFEIAVNNLKTEGAKSLIIDLRDNPGGMLDTVLNMADFLMPEGEILRIDAKNQEPQTFSSSAEQSVDMPICVLINGSSASASEVLAGALKDHGLATLVGEKTFGKGVVQSLYELSDGSKIKLTTAKYYTPSGVCIDQKGINPDVEVKMELTKNLGLYEKSEDIQLQKAIETLK